MSRVDITESMTRPGPTDTAVNTCKTLSTEEMAWSVDDDTYWLVFPYEGVRYQYSRIARMDSVSMDAVAWR